jgi:FMN phosphatase YigB (HAD superfamily)
MLKEKGKRLVLATNPIFPALATECRMGWAGLSPEDFEMYTTYENSSFCKPNTEYYRAILYSIGLSAEECLMVGNDVGEDMVASTLGMKVFLLTDCLINKAGEDISVYPQGGFDELISYLETL